MKMKVMVEKKEFEKMAQASNHLSELGVVECDGTKIRFTDGFWNHLVDEGKTIKNMLSETSEILPQVTRNRTDDDFIADMVWCAMKDYYNDWAIKGCKDKIPTKDEFCLVCWLAKLGFEDLNKLMGVKR